MLVIVNYGMGNLRSVAKAFERIGIRVTISSSPEVIRDAEKLILPGVGHFTYGMERLKELGLTEVLNEKVLKQKTPILGICLGMQLMTRQSEEGDAAGFGWIDALTVKFPPEVNGNKIKVPHIGWNNVEINHPHPVCNGIEKDDLFYFVHSYYVSCSNPEDSMLRSTYGISFDSGISHENIIGVQFHPEKSHKAGMEILRRFYER